MWNPTWCRPGVSAMNCSMVGACWIRCGSSSKDCWRRECVSVKRLAEGGVSRRVLVVCVVSLVRMARLVYLLVGVSRFFVFLLGIVEPATMRGEIGVGGMLVMGGDGVGFL